VQPVETSDPDGVDYGWVMQTTFVVTIVVGAPVVAALSLRATLPTWAARVEFAIRIGAVVWFLVAAAVYLYARGVDAGDGGADPDAIDDDATDPDGGRGDARAAAAEAGTRDDEVEGSTAPSADRAE
jgi:hypothetical protein